MKLSETTSPFGKPVCTATYKTEPEDFIVEEIPNFTPSGDGEHALLHIQKRNENTPWLAKQLARLAGIKNMDVGFAGMKDRHAVTTQWFSVRLAGKQEPEWHQLENENIKILQTTRHSRKIKRGALVGNRFRLLLRDVVGNTKEIEQRLQLIQQSGVPNYFGEQRFGRDGNNIAQALKLFRGELTLKNKQQRGIYLSAARAHLFNVILNKRIELNCWDKAIVGDVFSLAGSNSIFTPPTIDNQIIERLEQHDIHITAPLWGRGPLASQGDAFELETQVTAEYKEYQQGLVDAGLNQERRATRMAIKDLQWTFAEPSQLQLEFTLPAGSYATVLLSQLLGPAT